MNSDEIEELVKKDNVEALSKIDIFFNEEWTEKAVEYKAYKCLSHLIDKGTTISQFCFVRAAENNDFNFFSTYGSQFDVKHTYYEVLEATYQNDNSNLFKSLLDMFPVTFGNRIIYRKFAKYLLSDVSLGFREFDYVGELYAKVKQAFRTREMLERLQDECSNVYIGKDALREAIAKKIKLPLDRCRFTRRLYITTSIIRDRRDMIKYYSGKVTFKRK